MIVEFFQSLLRRLTGRSSGVAGPGHRADGATRAGMQGAAGDPDDDTEAAALAAAARRASAEERARRRGQGGGGAAP